MWVSSRNIEMPRPRAGLSFYSWPDFTSDSHYDSPTKPLPAPIVPGKTEAERFDNAIRQVFSVSKEEMQRREAERQKAQDSKLAK